MSRKHHGRHRAADRDDAGLNIFDPEPKAEPVPEPNLEPSR